MDIVSIKSKIDALKNEIEYLNNNINKIVNDNSYLAEEKEYYIAEIKNKIAKKNEILNKYYKELDRVEKERNILMINNLKNVALKSISGLVSDTQFAYYQNLLSSTNELDKLKPILDSINNIVRNDYINKVTSIDMYDPNSTYRLLCHSISAMNFDIDKNYGGEYISCSLLSNEQNDTYSSNIGLIYPPQSIVAASSGDFATYNYANKIEDVLITQLYPTIQNIDSVIKETVTKKSLSNEKEYNEVVVRKTEPIGIFYKGDYEELDLTTKTMLDKLKSKYPDLKVIGIPNSIKNIESVNNDNFIKHPKSKELNELEKQKQIAQQNNDEEAYNYFQQCIIKTIKENRMQVSLEQWTSFSKEQRESYIQIKMREAKILNDKDEFNYWLAVLNNLKQQDLGNSNNKIHSNTVSKTSLEGLKNSVGSTEGYTVLVHGTHLTDTEVEKMIFKEGLRATGKNEESSLVHTTQPLDIETYSLEELKSKMDNYGHNNRNMVIIKLPNKYFNMYADYGDRNCTRTRAFMKKIQVDGGYKYVLDPKFIVGSYNTETMQATLNNSFERELTNETRLQLKNNLDNLQKELGIDPDYIEAINSEEMIDVNQPLYNNIPINNEFKDEHKKTTQNNVTNKDYNYYFDEMVKLTQKYNSNEQMKEEQRKQLISEIFYNESYLVESLTNDEEIRQIMNRSVNELDNNEIQIKLQNVILNEIQEKYKQLHPVQQTKEENVSNNNFKNKESNLSVLISQLKTKLNRIQDSYHSMLSDGYIDDKELATLLALINKVIGEGYALKSLATDSNDLKVISVIIDSLEKEQTKMNKMQNGIEEMGKTMQ